MKLTLSRLALPLAACFLGLASGCLSDPDDAEFAADGELTLENFSSDFSSITSGTGADGELLQGEVTLSWEVMGAQEIRLFADGSEVAIDDCISPQDTECLQAHSQSLKPDQSTTYRLEAREGEECLVDENCLREEIVVDVIPPAQVTLEPEEGDRFVPGTDVVVNYSVDDAEEWEIGIVDGDIFDPPCEASSDAKCRLDHPEEGQLTLHELQEATTLSATATTGADDGLGDLAIGDLEFRLFPAGEPIVRDFTVTPEVSEYGKDVTLEWTIDDAEFIDISADPEGGFTESLEKCTDVDEEGQGQCDLTIVSSGDEVLDITLTAVASDDMGQESSPDTATLSLGFRPTIEKFELIEPEGGALEEGETDVALGWQIFDDPQSVEITADGETILELPDGIGQDTCGTDQDASCDLEEDEFWVSDITEPTEFTLTATNDFGDRSFSRSVDVADAPKVDELLVNGTSVLDEPAIIFDSTATLEWDADDTDEVLLERALSSTDDVQCSSGDLDFSTVNGFPSTEDGAEVELSDLDDHVTCFRFTASETQAGQTSTRRFSIIRGPEIDEFQVDPSQTTRGDTVTLSWDTRFSNTLEVTSEQDGQLAGGTLDDCTSIGSDGSGTCQVETLSGGTASDITFDAEATGYDDTHSQETSSTTLAIGEAPKITKFCVAVEDSDDCSSGLASTDDDDNFELRWEFEEAIFDDWTIEGPDGEIASMDDEDETEGTVAIGDDIEDTTTWTLQAHNPFGSDSSEVTLFFGPVIEEFFINGEDAIAGSVFAGEAGDIDIEFEITGLAEFSDLDDPPVDLAVGMPVGDSCDIDDDAWENLDFQADSTNGSSVGMTSFSGNATAVDRASNFCVFLSGENDATPPQESSLTALAETKPQAPPIPDADPDSIDGDSGDTVNLTIDYELGTESTQITAYYIGGNSFEHLDSCGEDTLGGEPGSYTCDHVMEGSCGIITIGGCEDDPPEDTTHIEYETCAIDADGDRNCTRGSGDEGTVSVD